MRNDTITVVVSGKCTECGCIVDSSNVGFECDDFIVCKSCSDEEENDYQDFLLEKDGR